MGISTKRAKRVVQNRVLTWKGNTDAETDTLIVVSEDPDIAVVWRQSNNTIITVLPRTKDDYVRTINGFEVIT